MHLVFPKPNVACFVVMLSGALQRMRSRVNDRFRHPKDGLYAAKHEARLSNISDYFRGMVWTE